ncbi:MAG: sigma 54-interacting transcriptional regulator [candidate division NC10 bacterium]|nr:sigma 54-interacting transcriptional regulator [candidate division NC10 bacterium]
MEFEGAADLDGFSSRQIRELLALYEIGKSLCSIHDLDLLLRFSIERVVTLLEVEASSVVLLDEETQELYFKVADDIRAGAEQKLREVRFPAHQGIAGWVVREGVAALVPDVSQDPRFYSGVDQETGTKTRSVVCVPLKTKDQIIGALNAVNKVNGHFSQEDVRLLEALASQLAIAIQNARLIEELKATRERLREENRYLWEEKEQAVRFETLVGESPRMQEVYALVERVLNTTVTVLLTGESGTGKELIARIIHYKGPRAKGPFIALNCSAIPETLLEAELFGYEKGAFTGATRRKPGRFDLAAGGTLFLDEIGEMSPALQAKLLRVLQDKRFERLGGTETIATNARIVAATNQDLEKLIGEGRFREDLFYRLSVYPIHLPPLRERREDILPLAFHFLKKSSTELRKEVAGLSKEARELLVAYDWLGNVREVENVMERAIILCRGTVVGPEDLPLSLRERPKAPMPLAEGGFTLPPGGINLALLEKQLILQALKQANHNKSKASRLLGLSRTQLRTRMKNYGLEEGE